ncbi:MAG: galactose oxidase [Cyanobium sp.]
MAASPLSSRGNRLVPSSAADDGGYEQWPYLDEEVLVASRSGKVCLTCPFFRHHAGVNCIPLLSYQLQQGLLAQGEDLTRRSPGWNDDQSRQRGWAPEGR